MAKSKAKPCKDDFIKHYVLAGCKNATQCAIKAGYSAKTADQAGSRLLKDVKVLTAIEEHKKLTQSEFIYSKDKKLEILQLVMDNSSEVCTEDGNFNKGKMNNPTAVISAIKEHNAMQGDNAPTVAINHNVTDSGENEW
jgi:phage terminase small subunit